MEKKNQILFYHCKASSSGMSLSNKVKKMHKNSKKSFNHQKILTEGDSCPGMMSSATQLAKGRFSLSQHKKHPTLEKLSTAGNTFSNWSYEPTSTLSEQLHTLTRQMADQNDRILTFMRNIQPQLQAKLALRKTGTQKRASLSSKIQSQCEMLRGIALHAASK